MAASPYKPTNPDKAIYPIAIYEFIRTNSDETKHLTIKDIVQHLRTYSAGIDERNIKRTVCRRIDDILLYDENVHVITKNGEEDYKPAETNHGEIMEIYYDQPFSATDVRIMSDAVIYSKHLKNKERKELLGKISELRPSHSNRWFKNALQDSTDQTKLESDLFRNLEYIGQAIEEKKCIRFDNMVYGADKRLHLAKSVRGFSPYKIYIDNDTYYVIGVTEQARIMKEWHSKKYPDSKINYAIHRFELFRMNKLRFDENAKYLPLEKTRLNGKSLKEICDEQFSIYGTLNNTTLSENVEIAVNPRGLQVLIKTFGNKIMVKNIDSSGLPSVVTEKYPEEVHYLVILKKAGRNEWNTILSLLNQYSIHDITLLSHKKQLSQMLSRISKQLEFPSWS